MSYKPLFIKAGDYYVNSLTINSISIVISSLTFLVASAIGIASSYLSGLFDERRVIYCIFY